MKQKNLCHIQLLWLINWHYSLSEVSKDKCLAYLRPDGKTQVTVEYDENDKPMSLIQWSFLLSIDPDVSQATNHDAILFLEVIKPVIPADMVDDRNKIFINPTGRFVIGGPQGIWLTGRKIIVDTYGGYARHGGGAFSGKGLTKFSRSAAYAARYVAKNIVAAV